jgi:hypothetical protein
MKPTARAFLVLAALAAIAVPAARAADGDPWILGQGNNSSSPTGLTNTDSARVLSIFSSRFAFQGEFAVRIESTGFAVYPLFATTPQSTAGVWGNSDGLNQAAAGVRGTAQHGSGVLGESSSEDPVPAGVTGVHHGSGAGVAGESNSGTGVRGHSSDGVAVDAESEHGTALSVHGASDFSGPTSFSRSGVLTIPAGSSSARQSVALESGSFVLATMQRNVPGLLVRAAVPNPDEGSLTIYLNHVANVDTPVGWFVVN